MNEVCSKDGCDESGSFKRFKYKPLCEKHYDHALDICLQELYGAWERDHDPSFKFKQMLGRVSSDQRWEYNNDESYLSYARIRNRAYAFEKTGNGCTFKITRHPGAHSVGYDPEKRIVQTWEADLAMKNLNFLDERAWKEGDPDPPSIPEVL